MVRQESPWALIRRGARRGKRASRCPRRISISATLPRTPSVRPRRAAGGGAGAGEMRSDGSGGVAMGRFVPRGARLLGWHSVGIVLVGQMWRAQILESACIVTLHSGILGH